jgi:ferric-dicitrate binding protein FerR (iron transport regulator)
MSKKEIIERYLSGKGTKEDKMLITEWFSSITEEKALRELSRTYWESEKYGNKLSQDRAASLLDRIHHTMHLADNVATGERKAMNRYLQVLSRIAAILFIPLLAVSLVLLSDIKEDQGDVYSEIVCPPGTRTKFHLPDGSRGWLNSGSSIKFPLKFSDDTREVRLTGEGYFEVESSKKRPFIVHAGAMQVRATGTEFNISAYEKDDFAIVTLVEGSVDLLRTRDGILRNVTTLKEGSECQVSNDDSPCILKAADVEKTIAWKEGKLIFRDDSFKEVVRKCNRWYNVHIEIADKELEDFTYVGTFRDETLDEVLKLLTLTAPITYEDLGRKKRQDGTFEKRHILLKKK